MQSSLRPVESSPPNGPRASSAFPTKAQKLLLRYQPEMPPFPLPEDAVAAVADRPGELPRSESHFARLLSADGTRQRRGRR